MSSVPVDSSTPVRLYRGNELLATAQTDITGNYHFINLPSGIYRLEIETATEKLLAETYSITAIRSPRPWKGRVPERGPISQRSVSD